MGLRVNTNLTSLSAQGTLRKTTKEAEESSGKLSSGLRITKAADDAAGLAISEKIKSHLRSSHMANRNANDGLSLVQTAEGGLGESSSILTRMRELAMQASTDTLTDADRQKSGMEYDQLKLELERISQSTSYNGRNLLDGSGETLDFQVGVGYDDDDDRLRMNPAAFNSGVDALGIREASILSKESAQASLDQTAHAINHLVAQRAQLGSLQNRLTSTVNNLMIYSENMSATNNRIRDLDYAVEAANHAKLKITSEAGVAVLSQANTTGSGALKLV